MGFRGGAGWGSDGIPGAGSAGGALRRGGRAAARADPAVVAGHPADVAQPGGGAPSPCRSPLGGRTTCLGGGQSPVPRGRAAPRALGRERRRLASRDPVRRLPHGDRTGRAGPVGLRRPGGPGQAGGTAGPAQRTPQALRRASAAGTVLGAAHAGPTAPAAKPTPWPPTTRHAPTWPTNWDWTPARSCGSCASRSSPATRLSPHPRPSKSPRSVPGPAPPWSAGAVTWTASSPAASGQHRVVPWSYCWKAHPASANHAA